MHIDSKGHSRFDCFSELIRIIIIIMYKLTIPLLFDHTPLLLIRHEWGRSGH